MVFFLLACVALGFIAIRKDTWLATIVYIFAIIIVMANIIFELGTPRPSWSFVPPIKDSTLIAKVLDEPHAIYIWVTLADSNIPTAIKLPWNEGAAAALQEAVAGAKSSGAQVKVSTKRGTPMFYISPITDLPEKQK